MPMPRGARGPHHYRTKLTEAQVHEIRASTEATAVLAQRYGMSHGAIAAIRHGRSWRHLQQTPAEAGLAPFVAPDLPEGVLAIQLFDGSLALIDAEDAELVTGRPWFVQQPAAGLGQVVTAVEQAGHPHMIALHRLLLTPPPDQVVIHRDGDPLNCRRSNLQVVPEGVARQRAKLARHNTSGYKGVSQDKRRAAQGRRSWVAYIKKDGRSYHLGSFVTAEEVAQRYNAAARALYGPDAFQNPIDEEAGEH